MTQRYAPPAMPLYDYHVFVCCNERPAGHPRGCCAAKGSPMIRDALKSAVAAAGLKGRVRINQAGCLDQCEHGPTVVVYPDAVWYGCVRIEDVPELVQSHLQNRTPVARLALSPDCINSKRCPHRVPAEPA